MVGFELFHWVAAQQEKFCEIIKKVDADILD
jgi:hypothetical protein